MLDPDHPKESILDAVAWTPEELLKRLMVWFCARTKSADFQIVDGRGLGNPGVDPSDVLCVLATLQCTPSQKDECYDCLPSLEKEFGIEFVAASAVETYYEGGEIASIDLLFTANILKAI